MSLPAALEWQWVGARMRQSQGWQAKAEARPAGAPISERHGFLGNPAGFANCVQNLKEQDGQGYR